MAKIADNIILTGIKGMLGDMLVFREVKGQTIVSTKPKKPTSRTQKQQEGQERFKKAVAYAKSAMADADTKALYATGISSRCSSAHQVAIADYLNGPRIESIDTSHYNGQAGSSIIVNASDDFMVVTVQVTIHTADGEQFESGNAVKNATDNFWTYTTTQQNASNANCQATITATDLPGNTTTRSFAL